MDIEFLVEQLEHYILDECPKFLGNRLVNEEEIRTRLRQLREAVPAQIREAETLLHQRDAVLEEAHQQAERILAEAREQAQELIAEHRLSREARRQADAILRRAEREAKLLQSEADEYVFDTLSQLQQELTRILHVVENGLQKLESDRERDLHRQEADASPRHETQAS